MLGGTSYKKVYTNFLEFFKDMQRMYNDCDIIPPPFIFV